MVMGSRSEGNQKERTCLLLIDSHSGLERAYPAPGRDQKFVRQSLQHLHCSKHPSTKTLFRTDCAKELVGAAKDLGFIPDPSLPQRRVHNARCENRINTVKRGARAALLQSGLPHEMWPECVQCITDARSFTIPSVCDESMSRFEAATGEVFKGQIIPFGALIYYRPYNANKTQKPLEAWSKPGIMLGYEVRPGLKWSKGYRILDYERLQKRSNNAFAVITVPELKLPVDDEGKSKFIFPIAAAREKAASTFQPLEFNALELDKIENEVAALEDEEDVPLLTIDDEFLSTQKKPRAVKVTLDRIIRLGPSPDCNGCSSLGQSRHTTACHDRFAQLLKDEVRCDICEALFSSRNALFKHLREDHPSHPKEEKKTSKQTSTAPGLMSVPLSTHCVSCLERSYACICFPCSSPHNHNIPACPANVTCCPVIPASC